MNSALRNYALRIPNYELTMQYVRDNIAQMGGYISGEQPQSGDFIKLNTNENPYPASERVREAIAKAAHTLNLYPNAMGTPFRKAAAEVLGVDPSWIMCGNGSTTPCAAPRCADTETRTNWLAPRCCCARETLLDSLPEPF